MKPVRALCLAGVAAIALAGSFGLAEAKDPAVHVMTVQLPTGEVAQIQYVGDVAPGMVLVPVAEPVSTMPPVGNPFAMMDAMAAQMDREMASLMHQVDRMSAASEPGLTEAGFGQVPAGVTEYSVVSTLMPNGVCTRTVRISATPGQAQPRMVSQASGACGEEAHDQAVPAEQTAPVPSSRGTRTIEVKDQIPVLPRQAPTYRG